MAISWQLRCLRGCYVVGLRDFNRVYAVVTPLRRAASYEPRIAILGIWGDTWLTRGKYGIYMYVGVTGPLRGLRDAFWKFCHVKSACVSNVTVTRIPSLVLRNTWHYVIIVIRRRKFWFPKFVLRCSYEAALRKGVTTAYVLLFFAKIENSKEIKLTWMNTIYKCVYKFTFNLSIWKQ